MSQMQKPGTVTADGLLERDAELATLAERLAGVTESRLGGVVLIRGEAGVGKTALIRAFCDEHVPSEALLRGACEPLFTPRPLGPLFEVAETAGGELVGLVERGAKPYEVVAALTAELTDRSPAVFVLEDVHWADEATLDVFRLLARRVATLPALVIASYRDDGLDVADPLRIVIGELATSPSIGRMKLGGLSPAAVAELAEPYGADADELYAKTGGNPFFVVEALAAEADAIPETVRDAVLARAARLDPTGRAVLEAVSVVPAHAEPWLLSAMLDGSTTGLDECLSSGMLRSEPAGISFRHELARLAVDDSVAPGRKIELHRAALAALADSSAGSPDPARLAHHAEAAGDADAVLRFAPAAAERAEAVGAHREAAAQYARVLRFGDGLTTAQRADVLERRSRACYLTDDIGDGIDAAVEALELRRALGQKRQEGGLLGWLSEILWCPGRTADSNRAAAEAVALLEPLPPGRELAYAYLRNGWHLADEALALAETLGDTEITLRARASIGSRDFASGGQSLLEESFEQARAADLVETAGYISTTLAGSALGARRYDLAGRYIETGLPYCSDRGLELYRYYLLGYRARVELDQGRWDSAAETAASVLRIRRASIMPHITALVVLGLVRARRGDPGHESLLAEAWALGEPTVEMFRMGPPVSARAEVAWLAGDRASVVAITEEPLRLALDQRDHNAIGQLGVWRRRAGVDERLPDAVEPFAAELAGDAERAAASWDELGCPYEAALARAQSEDEQQLRRALAELQQLGARPAATIVAGRLRGRGVRGLPRGPRPATRENPAGLTPRQLEVLELLAEGMRDSEIAARLVLSERTVGHHVGAILRKLGARNRGQATVEALRLGLVSQDR